MCFEGNVDGFKTIFDIKIYISNITVKNNPTRKKSKQRRIIFNVNMKICQNMTAINFPDRTIKFYI